MQAIKETGTLRSEVMFIGEFFPEEFMNVYYDKLGDWCMRGAVSEYINYQLSEEDLLSEFKIYIIWINSFRPESIMFKGRFKKFFIT